MPKKPVPTSPKPSQRVPKFFQLVLASCPNSVFSLRCNVVVLGGSFPPAALQQQLDKGDDSWVSRGLRRMLGLAEKPRAPPSRAGRGGRDTGGERPPATSQLPVILFAVVPTVLTIAINCCAPQECLVRAHAGWQRC